jgi:hypothetical protein
MLPAAGEETMLWDIEGFIHQGVDFFGLGTIRGCVAATEGTRSLWGCLWCSMFVRYPVHPDEYMPDALDALMPGTYGGGMGGCCGKVAW